jgi:hypothetical protein
MSKPEWPIHAFEMSPEEIRFWHEVHASQPTFEQILSRFGLPAELLGNCQSGSYAEARHADQNAKEEPNATDRRATERT